MSFAVNPKSKIPNSKIQNMYPLKSRAIAEDKWYWKSKILN